MRAGDARVVIAGASGAGKSTLAREISARTGIPHVEIDALHWGAGWTSRPEFLDDVRAFVAEDRWITEWQYRRARDLVVARATVLVWLDLPFPLVLARVVRRTAQRRRRRTELWNGNVEPGLRHALLNPEGVIRWSVATRRKYAPLIAALETTAPHVAIIRPTAGATLGCSCEPSARPPTSTTQENPAERATAHPGLRGSAGNTQQELLSCRHRGELRSRERPHARASA